MKIRDFQELTGPAELSLPSLGLQRGGGQSPRKFQQLHREFQQLPGTAGTGTAAGKPTPLPSPALQSLRLTGGRAGGELFVQTQCCSGDLGITTWKNIPGSALRLSSQPSSDHAEQALLGAPKILKNEQRSKNS